ncbi:NeuD/PglB/VioB family sugar acetyltransferase [Microbacterium sp.]|uniref:NeuD/PglB/VioB family sugar acetyltransferase n=1 Tax=Microbacterium sp. TaxID=51671 RepID=UPI0028118B7B|nr:NeuD/PglB/VioB family sugar acetyltransferase [Microbacterium sp.]
MPEDVVVVGAGGFGRETLDVIEAINDAGPEPVWNIVGVVDDGPAEIQLERLRDRGVAMLGGLDAYRSMALTTRFVVGIGSPRARARIAASLEEWGGRAATLVHPAAVVGARAVVGAGVVICGGVQVSTNVVLGEHVHLNPGAIIGHDAVLESCVSVNPGAIVSGEVRVGRESLIGAGAVVLQNLAVGEEAIVGASACVTKNVASRGTVAGVPARLLGRDGNA